MADRCRTGRALSTIARQLGVDRKPCANTSRRGFPSVSCIITHYGEDEDDAGELVESAATRANRRILAIERNVTAGKPTFRFQSSQLLHDRLAKEKSVPKTRLTQLEEQEVEKTNETVLALEGEYAGLLSELKRLWKAYYLNRPRT